MIYLNARSAMSWNQMALTIFERRKNGRTHRVLKATDNTGSVFFHTASALKYIISMIFTSWCTIIVSRFA